MRHFLWIQEEWLVNSTPAVAVTVLSTPILNELKGRPVISVLELPLQVDSGSLACKEHSCHSYGNAEHGSGFPYISQRAWLGMTAPATALEAPDALATTSVSGRTRSPSLQLKLPGASQGGQDPRHEKAGLARTLVVLQAGRKDYQ